MLTTAHRDMNAHGKIQTLGNLHTSSASTTGLGGKRPTEQPKRLRQEPGAPVMIISSSGRPVSPQTFMQEKGRLK